MACTQGPAAEQQEGGSVWHKCVRQECSCLVFPHPLPQTAVVQHADRHRHTKDSKKKVSYPQAVPVVHQWLPRLAGQGLGHQQLDQPVRGGLAAHRQQLARRLQLLPEAGLQLRGEVGGAEQARHAGTHASVQLSAPGHLSVQL